MSEHLHPGLHPDPDSLSAFIEGVLPEHERLQCLAHLAECSRCREVVFLSQEPAPVPAAPNPTPAWRRWFAPVPVLAAAATGIAAVAVSLYLHDTVPVPRPGMVASSRPAPPLVTPEAQPRTSPAAKANSLRAFVPGGGTVTATATPPGFPPPPTIPFSAPSELIPNQLPPALRSALTLPSALPSIDIKDDRASISGTITDQTGAAIPGASITLRQPRGTFNRDARTDVAGRFTLTGLPAGRYELQINAPGFRRTVKEVELPPLESAAITSVLEVGSVSETVEVTAEAPVLQTSSASARSERRRKTASPPEPRPLPSKLPASITVTSGKAMLAVDSAGALFLSRNAGKGWKRVKPAWPGKVVQLITLDEPSQTPAAVFQLTTDSDAAWLSRDGNHWYPAPSRR